MGKWADRLAEKTAAPPQSGTDKTDKRGVLSVLSVTPQGVEGFFSAAREPANPQTVAADAAEVLDLRVSSQPENIPLDEVLSACTHAVSEAELDCATKWAEPVDLAPDGKTEAECERFAWRLERLTRWGWPQADAQELAERLTQRDRTDDDRVTCTDCHHYRPGRCGNHRQAGLTVSDVGRALAALLQQCAGFQPAGTAGVTFIARTGGKAGHELENIQRNSNHG